MPSCICSSCIFLEICISDPTSSKAQDFSCRCAARAGVLPDIFRAFSIIPTPLLNKLWYLSHDFFGCFNVTYPKKLLDLKSGCWTRKIGSLQCYFVAAISLFFFFLFREQVLCLFFKDKLLIETKILGEKTDQCIWPKAENKSWLPTLVSK